MLTLREVTIFLKVMNVKNNFAGGMRTRLVGIEFLRPNILESAKNLGTKLCATPNSKSGKETMTTKFQSLNVSHTSIGTELNSDTFVMKVSLFLRKRGG